MKQKGITMTEIDFAGIFPFWDKLSNREKTQIIEASYIENYEKGNLMYRSKDNCKGLMTVQSGQLRTYIVSEEGREVTLFRVHDQDVCVLSASCLMDSIDFDVVIEAVEQTEVIVIPSVDLNHIMKSNPYVELYMYKAASEKFTEVMWTMQKILFQKMDQRIAQFLIDEMKHKNENVLEVTHDEIARYIGSAREVVTKGLKYLAEQGLIELKRGKIVIVDHERLEKYNN